MIKGLSVIIPCWNDAEALRHLLAILRSLTGVDEVIVADASPHEECRQLAREAGAILAHCSRVGRGSQLNRGARLATGQVLLFQHADTDLTQPHVDALRRAMHKHDVAGGAFHRKFDQRHARLRWLEPWVRAWAQRGGALYGDQSIFVRRDVFERLGGFAEIPLMEDLEFSRRLRAAAKTVVIDPPIRSSARNHERRGAWRTTLRNAGLITLFKLGVAPERLHAWYYGASPGGELDARRCCGSR